MKKVNNDRLNEMSSSKTLYSVVNKLLDNKQETVLPSSKSNKNLADSFMNYFLEKILKIRSKFKENHDVNGTANSVTLNMQTKVQCLSVLEKATADEIRQITRSYGVKCSPEDPIPAKLLQGNLGTNLVTIGQLIS